MTKKISAYILILSVHLLLVYGKILPGELRSSLALDAFLALLFCLGLLIAVPGFRKGPENFALRFLVMTTVQMLLMLTLILVFAFAEIGDVQVQAFTAMALFILLLGVQSFFLIREVRKQ